MAKSQQQRTSRESSGKHCQRKRRLRTMETGAQTLRRLSSYGKGGLTDKQLNNIVILDENGNKIGWTPSSQGNVDPFKIDNQNGETK